MTLDELQLPRLPERDPSGHKGTFGTVGVIGGGQLVHHGGDGVEARLLSRALLLGPLRALVAVETADDVDAYAAAHTGHDGLGGQGRGDAGRVVHLIETVALAEVAHHLAL